MTVIESVDNDIGLLTTALERGRRIERVCLSGRTVWVKRYGAEGIPLRRRFHLFSARLVPISILRTPPILPAADMVAREVRRMAEFKQHGIPAPQVIHADQSVMILADTGPTVADRLRVLWREGNHPEAVALQAQCAAALGQVHAKGLCHGRPHPRDMFLDNGQVGFLDFEEEPCLVMPLETAQTRDALLLFHNMVIKTSPEETPFGPMFEAWSRYAPPGAVAQFKANLRFMAKFAPLARTLLYVLRARDIRRFLALVEFFGRSE